jgi:oligopeptide/dipeptide ABC transporter ATP-binding protein
MTPTDMTLTDMNPSTAIASAVLKVEGLSIGFPHPVHGAWIPLVQDLHFQIAPGQILGLVGESGCGKSLTSLAILGLLPPPGRILSGAIQLNGVTLNTLAPEAYRRLRGKDIGFIPQDPLSALNPVYTIGNQLEEILITHTTLDAPARRLRMLELLDAVRISTGEARLKAYPHEFSGGMRQRVLIAMALACTPKLLIADEPTTALDVTVQADILSLIQDLCRDFQMASLLITHDMGVVAEVCDHVAVMYAGHLVETAAVDDLFASPRHPYTLGLLHSFTRPTSATLSSIEGMPPTISILPEAGCRFIDRCARADAVICSTDEALILKSVGLGHEHRCIRSC